jgi:flagellar biosynthetic protein FliR
MISFTEAQLLAWLTPVLWPFLRALALFTALPVMGARNVPARVRVALAALVALCAQPVLPPMPQVALDSPLAFMLVVQQVLIGVTIGFAVRVVFAAVEYAGELIGLQMGLNFAMFFDPVTNNQATTTARLFNTTVSWLFIVANGHLLVVMALVDSFNAFPVGPEPRRCHTSGVQRCSARGCGSRCRWWR